MHFSKLAFEVVSCLFWVLSKLWRQFFLYVCLHRVSVFVQLTPSSYTDIRWVSSLSLGFGKGRLWERFRYVWDFFHQVRLTAVVCHLPNRVLTAFCLPNWAYTDLIDIGHLPSMGWNLWFAVTVSNQILLGCSPLIAVDWRVIRFEYFLLDLFVSTLWLLKDFATR